MGVPCCLCIAEHMPRTSSGGLFDSLFGGYIFSPPCLVQRFTCAVPLGAPAVCVTQNFKSPQHGQREARKETSAYCTVATDWGSAETAFQRHHSLREGCVGKRESREA
jgi:hypothetical protein